MPENKTYYEAGTAIRGDRIAAKARKISKVEVRHGEYGSHRAQCLTLKEGAYCIIEVPLKSVRKY